MLTALPDSTNDLTLPFHEQRSGAATDSSHIVISESTQILIMSIIKCEVWCKSKFIIR